MAFSYDIKTSKKDTGSSVCLFISHIISAIVNLFVSTFLVAYIYNFSGGVHDYILRVAVYEISHYCALLVVFCTIMYFVEKSNRVWFYRIGVILRLGLVLFAVFYGKQLATLLPLAGVLDGVSSAVYYAGYNVMKQEMVSRKSMKSYIVTFNVIRKVVGIVSPIVLGALIEVSTYTQVAVYVVAICLVQIVLSFGIKAQRPQGSRFDMKDYFARLKQMPEIHKKLKFIYLIEFVNGCTTVVDILVSVCVMMQFGSSFKLGIFTSIFAVVSIVTLLIVSKLTVPGKRSFVFAIFAVMPLLCTIVFVIFPGVVTLIVYNFGVATTNIVLTALFDTYKNSTLKENGMYDCIPEHQVALETCIEIGRLLIYAIMVGVACVQSLVLFKIFLCIVICTYTVVYIMLMKFEKIYAKQIIGEKEEMKIIFNCLKNT